MHRLSQIVLFLLMVNCVYAQKSPHESNLKVDCAECHTIENWKVNSKAISFDHNKATKFKLDGQHKQIDCKMCHETLKFCDTKGKDECVSCHTDMHNQTLGSDCASCHNTSSWIVADIKGLHQKTRFPLVGSHAVALCRDCHKSGTELRFDPLGVECVDCHRANYLSTTSPNHITSGYSTECVECHSQAAPTWTASNFLHDFFPLTAGHANLSCIECHGEGKYSKVPTDCFYCHEFDYNKTTSPNHVQQNFSQNCTECHTTGPSWLTAEYREHDSKNFPIYSGEHKGEWDKCTDCHTGGDISTFSCTNCHEHNKTSMNLVHLGKSGYEYKSSSCYSCHPDGSKHD